METREQKFQITCTARQLSLIARCVEDCCRFASGQVGLTNTTLSIDKYCELYDELKKLKHLVTPELPFYASYGWNGNHCPNESQRKFIAQTYPIYREIYHFFAVDGGLDNVYSSPTLTCEEGGAPIKIEKVKTL